MATDGVTDPCKEFPLFDDGPGCHSTSQNLHDEHATLFLSHSLQEQILPVLENRLIREAQGQLLCSNQPVKVDVVIELFLLLFVVILWIELHDFDCDFWDILNVQGELNSLI